MVSNCSITKILKAIVHDRCPSQLASKLLTGGGGDRQYSAHGKRSADTWSSGKTHNERLHSEACMMDHAWALVRMTQLKLFEVDLFQSDKQTVHGWSGFNTVVHSCG